MSRRGGTDTDIAAAGRQNRRVHADEFAAQIDAADAYSLFAVAGEWESVENSLTDFVCRTYLRENGIAQGDRGRAVQGSESLDGLPEALSAQA